MKQEISGLLFVVFIGCCSNNFIDQQHRQWLDEEQLNDAWPRKEAKVDNVTKRFILFPFRPKAPTPPYPVPAGIRMANATNGTSFVKESPNPRANPSWIGTWNLGRSGKMKVSGTVRISGNRKKDGFNVVDGVLSIGGIVDFKKKLRVKGFMRVTGSSRARLLDNRLNTMTNINGVLLTTNGGRIRIIGHARLEGPVNVDVDGAVAGRVKVEARAVALLTNRISPIVILGTLTVEGRVTGDDIDDVLSRNAPVTSY